MIKKLYTLALLVFISISALSAQECGFVYVTPTGASSGAAGTRANPANLSYGLTLLGGSNNIMRLAEGEYIITNHITVPSNITLEGGFNATTWVKSNSTPTNIHRTSANIQTNPNRLIALSAISVSNFNLLDLTITVDNAVGNGVTTYGIYLGSCSNYVVSRCIIDCGAGSAGLADYPVRVAYPVPMVAMENPAKTKVTVAATRAWAHRALSLVAMQAEPVVLAQTAGLLMLMNRMF
ncbi:MAG: hypothetical protein M0D57_12080 [Sphingobacteriales bacterium JAD_PAG50586_3]|nr:MAG: hypothetical protein M0D57_12080 [Sphingobacteriales bacterium JAD_PAG50586_3]